MTTQPEAAMTRERALAALKKYDVAMDQHKSLYHGNQAGINQAVPELVKIVRALASARQEPAPAAEVVTDEMVRKFRIAFHECTMHHPNPASLPDYAVRKGLIAALASTRREPVSAANVEEVPTKDDARRSLTLLREHLSNATPGTMEHEDYLSRISFLEQMLQLPDDPTSARTASIELLARHTFERMGCIADDEKCIAILAAALRRYAGDGGVEGKITNLQTRIDLLLEHCRNYECSTCAAIMCPHGDDLHFHHDGCPSCFTLGTDSDGTEPIHPAARASGEKGGTDEQESR